MNVRVTTSFDRAASTYATHAHVQALMRDWLCDWLPAERTGRALEIGAGQGLFTRKIVDWPGGVTATDISRAMCAAGKVAMPQVDWRVMAAEKPLPGPWRWIFSSSMLQWIQEADQTFAAWRTRLAPGGRILAGLFVAESLPELRELCGGYTPLEWRTPEQWRASLARSGLRIVRDTVERRVFIYRSAREFLRTLHGVGATPLRRFTAGQMRRLLRDYETQFCTADGVRATWTFYRFEAEHGG